MIRNSKVLGLSTLDLESIGSLKNMYEESLGLSSSILASIRNPSFGVLDEVRKLAFGVDQSQVLGVLSAVATTSSATRFVAQELGLLNLKGLTATTDVARLSHNYDLLRLTSAQHAVMPTSVLTDLGLITSFTRNLGTTNALAAMFQPTSNGHPISAMDGLSSMTRAINRLPAWLKPESPLQAIQPSWEIAASLGVAGIGRPSLVEDALGAIYSARSETIGFEAVVQMLQVADEAEDELPDRALVVLRAYTAALVELLGQTKDWVKRQGLISILVFFVGVITLYETHLERLATETQTSIALERNHSAQSEIAQHRVDLTRFVSRCSEERDDDKDARVLIHAAPLRAKPQAKGIIIRQLYPDDRVRVLEVSGGWARVEVYQYNSENVINGWLNRRVLRLYER